MARPASARLDPVVLRSSTVFGRVLNRLVAKWGDRIQGHTYGAPAVFHLVLYAAIQASTLTMARKQLASGPSANTVRYHLEDQVLGDIAVLEDELNELLVSDLLPGLRGGRAKVAIDLVDVPYQGQPLEEEKELCRGPAKEGTTWFHRYATAYVIKKNKRCTIAMTYVRKGEKLTDVLQRLWRRLEALGLTIARLYLDKGFCSIPVLRFLRRQGLPFVMPMPVRGGAERGVRRLFHGRRGYATRYTMRSEENGRLTVDVWVACKYNAGKYERHGVEYFVYIIHDIPEGSWHQLYEDYRQRFGIESSYRLMNRVRARTSSRNPALRLLYVGLALVLLNLWVACKWESVSHPRRGGRWVYHDRFPLDLFCTFLRTEIEGRYGVVKEIVLPPADPAAASSRAPPPPAGVISTAFRKP